MPFDQWDANKDGVVTLDEVRGSYSPFPEDEADMLYACGLDHQGQCMSLAAWMIYCGDSRTVAYGTGAP